MLRKEFLQVAALTDTKADIILGDVCLVDTASAHACRGLGRCYAAFHGRASPLCGESVEQVLGFSLSEDRRPRCLLYHAVVVSIAVFLTQVTGSWTQWASLVFVPLGESLRICCMTHMILLVPFALCRSGVPAPVIFYLDCTSHLSLSLY